MKRIILLPAILLLMGHAPAQTTAGQRTIFEFHSGFWINLHQFLIHQAAAPNPTESDSPEWRDAIAYYRREMPQDDLLKPGAAALNNRLSAAGSADELPLAGIDATLAAILTKAAPVYRRAWWPDHNRSNLSWIDAAKPLIEKYGASMSKDIAAAYQTPWPQQPIRVDVCAYAGPVGAYTTVEPTHITVSSTDTGYQGDAALEMLFHESSHSLDEKLQTELQRELNARGLLFKRRGFSHAVLFYTAGEITRKYLPGYQPYGVRHRILENGWPGSLPVLEKDWKPYLDGHADLPSAVRAIVTDYSVPK